MKKCPQCQQTYENNLSFCLQDGTALILSPEPVSPTEAETEVNVNPFPNESQRPPIYVDLGENPTVASSQPPQQPPEQTPPPNVSSNSQINFLSILLGAIIVLILGVIGGGGLYLYFSGSFSDIANDNREKDKAIKKKPEKTKDKETIPEIKEEDSPDDEEDLDEPTETPTPEQKVCYLSNGSGGEVRVRRNCDTSNCTTNASTIAGTYSNETPLTKLGQSIRSGKYTWTKVSIKGGVYWVASSKIRCP